LRFGPDCRGHFVAIRFVLLWVFVSFAVFVVYVFDWGRCFCFESGLLLFLMVELCLFWHLVLIPCAFACGCVGE